NGITKGVSETKFDADGRITDYAFLTSILRVLGYEDSKGDFVWNDPYALAKTVGLIETETPDNDFTRGDAFEICFAALTADAKGGKTVLAQLIEKGVCTQADYDAALGGANTPDTPDDPVADDPKPEVPANPVTELVAIKDLNKDGADGDHAEDDYTRASVEVDYRTIVKLTSQEKNSQGQTRYDKAWYPRIKKVNEDLYLLFFHYGQLGQHVYWTYSKDGGKTFANPEVFHGSTWEENKFTYTDGDLAGTADMLYGVNADACVLQNGEILAVYSVRPCKGYQTYIDLSGIYLRRGRVDAQNNVSWSDPVKIYTGIQWEPFIFQREDGQIECYFSSSVCYIDLYGFTDKRSACAGMIVSNDNGYTWTPNVQAGDKNNYAATRVFQQALGDKTFVSSKTGTEMTVPFFGGQMPSAARLYNGKTMIAVEVQDLKLDFSISFGTSPVGGNWKPLGLTEVGPDEAVYHAFDGAAPYLARFLSGEVLLSYTSNSMLYGRMCKPDGSAVDSKGYALVPDAKGSWGATEIVGSHTVLCTAPVISGDIRGVKIVTSYLNHRINAKNTAVSVDGYTNEWTDNTDAFFVGSETQAQVTLRAAHDKNNLYFLLSRLDTYLTEGDTVTINIAAGSTSYYKLTLWLSGKATLEYYESSAKKSSVDLENVKVVLKGTLGNNDDKDEGAVIELALPKSAVGLAGASSMEVKLDLSNQDGVGSTADTMSGLSNFTTARWPVVALD
ncbi:MAG: exo-alpha-sialidase, partial [Clostridia bacterium]|nr:exo-alpha-sialidase [Clostridia bacterium]